MHHAWRISSNHHDGGWWLTLPSDRSQRNLQDPRVSVVIPALNEASNLPLVMARLPAGLFEVVVVDGGSTDGTPEVARDLREDVRVLDQSGQGKGNALATGFAAARGDILVTLDADGSTDPAEIPRFVAVLLAGADVAKGSRFAHGGGSADITRTRRVGNRMLCALVNGLYGTYYTDLCYGYNAFWVDCLPLLSTPRPLYPADPSLDSPFGDGFEVETVLNVRAAKGALRVWEVPSYELRRIHGQSNLKAIRDGLRVVRTIWGESPAISARYSPRSAAPTGSVGGILPPPAVDQVARRGRLSAGLPPAGPSGASEHVGTNGTSMTGARRALNGHDDAHRPDDR